MSNGRIAMKCEIETCWRRIGVQGSGSCPNLEANIHCRNCPGYAKAGRELLERAPSEEYLLEWSQILKHKKETLPSGVIAAISFRLGIERLLIGSRIVDEITSLLPIHSLPHRKNSILLGLVNLRGEIQLCVSLERILGIPKETKKEETNRLHDSPRMITIGEGKNRWVFPVDEVYGIHKYHPSVLRPVPITIAQSTASFTKGIFIYKDHSYGCLDEERLLDHLQRSVC